MAAAFRLESRMKVTSNMRRGLKDAMILRMVLTQLMVSFLSAFKGKVLKANITSVIYLDTNNTMIHQQNLVSFIQMTEQYYPGLVVSIHDLAVYSEKPDSYGEGAGIYPNCSLEATDGNDGGISISNYTAEMLKGSCGSTIAQTPTSVTCVQRKMWLDYFCKPKIEIQSKVSEVPVSLDTHENTALNSND